MKCESEIKTFLSDTLSAGIGHLYVGAESKTDLIRRRVVSKHHKCAELILTPSNALPQTEHYTQWFQLARLPLS